MVNLTPQLEHSSPAGCRNGGVAGHWCWLQTSQGCLSPGLALGANLLLGAGAKGQVQFPIPGNRVVLGVGTRSQGSWALQNATRAAADTKLYLCSVAPLLFRQQWQHVPRQPQLGTVQS